MKCLISSVCILKSIYSKTPLSILIVREVIIKEENGLLELKANLGTSKQEVELVEKETLFLKDFIAYWKVIKNHRVKKIDKIRQVCQSLFEDYTKPFIEKWGDYMEAIKTNPESLGEYYSFELTTPSGHVMYVPHKVLVFESLRSDEREMHYLQRIKTLSEFLFYFERTTREINLPLNKSDVQILQVLSSNKFSGSLGKVPKIEDLAKFCYCDPQTYRRRTRRLEESYVLYYLYMIDMAKIGYETFISISRRNQRTKSDYNLISIPYNVGVESSNKLSNNKYWLAIYQIPYFKSEIYDEVKNQPGTVLWQNLSNSYIGANLTSLTPSVKSRWKILPPILSVMNWDDELIIANSNNGFTFDLTPQYDLTRLSFIDINILSLFGKYWGLSNVEVAKMSGINEKSVRNSWDKIKNLRLVKRFAYVVNLGFDIKLWISIIGDNPIDQASNVECIIEHLKIFPFSWLFYDSGDSTRETKPIITGLIYLPASWVQDFLMKFSLLSNYGFSTHIGLSHERFLTWKIDLSKTYI